MSVASLPLSSTIGVIRTDMVDSADLDTHVWSLAIEKSTVHMHVANTMSFEEMVMISSFYYNTMHTYHGT